MEDYIEIKGGNPLNGEIPFEASKNAVLPIMVGALIGQSEIKIEKAPILSDVFVMGLILRDLGCAVKFSDGALTINPQGLKSSFPKGELCEKLRASSLLIGGLLNKFDSITLPKSGGCRIGQRPIDIHLAGLSQMGYKIIEGEEVRIIRCKSGGDYSFRLPYPSVGATENLIMTALSNRGETLLSGCSVEPEVEDLCNFLKACGGDLSCDGRGNIKVKGGRLKGDISYLPIADRITAGTYLLAGAICGGTVKVCCNPAHLEWLITKLKESTCKIWTESGNIVLHSSAKVKSVGHVQTSPYPGFPTDLQAPFSVLACIAKGETVIKESVFENRFGHAVQLKKMGATLFLKEDALSITGGRLLGNSVYAEDLRGGAALVLAGLVAEGTTKVFNPDFIDRGYQQIEERLKKLGGDIKRNERQRKNYSLYFLNTFGGGDCYT